MDDLTCAYDALKSCYPEMNLTIDQMRQITRRDNYWSDDEIVEICKLFNLNIIIYNE